MFDSEDNFLRALCATFLSCQDPIHEYMLPEVSYWYLNMVQNFTFLHSSHPMPTLAECAWIAGKCNKIYICMFFNR